MILALVLAASAPVEVSVSLDAVRIGDNVIDVSRLEEHLRSVDGGTARGVELRIDSDVPFSLLQRVLLSATAARALPITLRVGDARLTLADEVSTDAGRERPFAIAVHPAEWRGRIGATTFSSTKDLQLADLKKNAPGQRRATFYVADAVTAQRLATGWVACQAAGIDQLRVAPFADLDKVEALAIGTISKEAVMSVMQAATPRVRACFDTALQRSPHLKGRVVVQFVIGPTGKVTRVDLKEDPVNDRAMGGCILAVVKGLEFEPPTGGSVTINYPFVFAPKGS